jgi:hypothetical protein
MDFQVQGYQALDRLKASESRLTLGVDTAPDGNSDEEYKKLLAASKKWSVNIKAGQLTKHDAWHAMSSTIWKTFEYPLPATTYLWNSVRRLWHQP